MEIIDYTEILTELISYSDIISLYLKFCIYIGIFVIGILLYNNLIGK